MEIYRIRGLLFFSCGFSLLNIMSMFFFDVFFLGGKKILNGGILDIFFSGLLLGQVQENLGYLYFDSFFIFGENFYIGIDMIDND